MNETSATKIDGRKKRRPGIDEQRRIIAKAALGLFGSRGSRLTSVSDICQVADVSRHTFYRCFEDKDDLIRDIYDDVADQHVQNFIIGSLPSVEAVDVWVKDAINQIVDAVMHEKDMANFLFTEFGDVTTPAYRIINEAFDSYAGVLILWIKSELEKDVSILLVRSIMISAQWILLETIRLGASPDRVDDAKRALYQLVAGAVLMN